MLSRVVWIHPEAPPKPEVGAPCNGCGLCCLAEPCPVGVLVTRRTQGVCKALEWSSSSARYECGVLKHPTRHLGLPGLSRWSAMSLLNRLLRRWAARMIAAGIGCDADLSPSMASSTDAPMGASLAGPQAPPGGCSQASPRAPSPTVSVSPHPPSKDNR